MKSDVHRAGRWSRPVRRHQRRCRGAGGGALRAVRAGRRVTSRTTVGTITSGALSGIDYLLDTPGAEFALFAWPVFLGGVSLAGGFAAWTRRGRWVWAAAATPAVLGMMTIGLLFAPAAALLLAAATLASAG